jgi:hypothetical protein
MTENQPSMMKTMNLSEAILQEQFSMIGQFTGGIVHNLNNPLNAISGTAQLMAMRDPENEKLKVLDEQIEILATMLRDLGQHYRRLHEPVTLFGWPDVLKAEIHFFQAQAALKHHCELDLHVVEQSSCPFSWIEATYLVDRFLLALVAVVPTQGMFSLQMGIAGGWPFLALDLPVEPSHEALQALQNNTLLNELLAPYEVALHCESGKSLRLSIQPNKEA